MTTSKAKKDTYPQLKVKRIYEPATDDDGVRVLVDLLWPRGVSKEQAKLDYWAKELTPSTNLRRAFHAGAIDYKKFSTLYTNYLNEQSAASACVSRVSVWLEEGPVTLLYAAKAGSENHAMVLRDWLVERLQY